MRGSLVFPSAYLYVGRGLFDIPVCLPLGVRRLFDIPFCLPVSERFFDIPFCLPVGVRRLFDISFCLPVGDRFFDIPFCLRVGVRFYDISVHLWVGGSLIFLSVYL